MTNSPFKKTLEEILAQQNVNIPRKRPSDEEHVLQRECVNWFRYQYPRYTHNLFAVPNGGKRDKVTAGKMKAEGALAGVADLILLLRTEEYGALLIEMKTRTGRQAETQKQWQRKIEADGYKYVVCRSVDDFIREVNNYLYNVI